MIKLVIQSGPQTSTEFPVNRPRVRLGRGSANDIILQDTQVSRQHAEISCQGDQFFIQDLGSTNGTFVNNERITAPRLLQPGDQIRIGDTVLACEAETITAGTATGEDWEAKLWEDELVAASERRQRILVWSLAGIVMVLALALVGGMVLLLKPSATPTPAAVVSISTSTSAIVVIPTGTPESTVRPTATPLIHVSVPTLPPVPTVSLKLTLPVIIPPSVPTSLPGSLPTLEQLPAIVATAFPNVPIEQLPEVIGKQIQKLSPEQAQAMITSLFPGVNQAQLPQVIAASFPSMALEDIQALLGMIFPGQTFPVPTAGPVGGRLVLGIYDRDRKQCDLYLASASGGKLTRLAEQAGDPDFSPDGQHLVYHSWAADRAGLRVMNTSGTDDKTLTAVDRDSYPSFAPDGERISYFNADNKTLHVINRDGTNRRDIGQGEYPAWSPTGDQIVYRGCVGGGRCGLVVANADGSNPKQITTYANDAAPRWSPNGGQIAFMSDRDGNWEVYVINSDGSWLRRITLEPATDIMPVWSPDGLRIAFRSDRGGKWAVWVTSGIGGGAFKMFDADPGPDWMWARMDWTR